MFPNEVLIDKIEKEKLVELATEANKILEKYVYSSDYSHLHIPFTEISKIPTADVVEVVRCKDCKHATFYSCKNDACYKGIICEYQITIGDENFFCACGEARTPKKEIWRSK